MPKLTNDFQLPPEEFQHILRLAQKSCNIIPFQLGSGERAEAVVHLDKIFHPSLVGNRSV